MESSRANTASGVAFTAPLETTVATRTLLAAGFAIKSVQRQPHHIEYFCERPDILGVTIPYLVAIFDTEKPGDLEAENVKRQAVRRQQVPVIISRESGAGHISWSDFLDFLGGAVPSWRALSNDFASLLRVTSKNISPPELKGEPWQLFEDAVADGIEFLLGKRVRRLGGRKRGITVSDMIACTPDQRILLIDAKASREPYSVGLPELRPLSEYVNRQGIRQSGQSEVNAALLVANSFSQNKDRLHLLAREFLAETCTPLGFLEVDALLSMIEEMAKHPRLRNSIRWSRIFCSGGPVDINIFLSEINAARTEAYQSSE